MKTTTNHGDNAEDVALSQPADELDRLRKENEALRNENLRYRNIIGSAEIPTHVDPNQLVVTWHLRGRNVFGTEAVSSDGTSPVSVDISKPANQQPVSVDVEPVFDNCQQDTAVSVVDTNTSEYPVFSDLLSPVESTEPASRGPPRMPMPNGLMPCVMPSGVMYPGTPGLPVINHNGQLVFLPPPAQGSSTQMPAIHPVPGTNDTSVVISSNNGSEVPATVDSERDKVIVEEPVAVSETVPSSTSEEPLDAATAGTSVAGLSLLDLSDVSQSEQDVTTVETQPEVPTSDSTDVPTSESSVSGHIGVNEIVDGTSQADDVNSTEATKSGELLDECGLKRLQEEVQTDTSEQFIGYQQSFGIDQQAVNADQSQQQSQQQLFVSQPQVITSLCQPFLPQQQHQNLPQQQQFLPPVPAVGQHQQQFGMTSVPAEAPAQNQQLQGTLVLHNGQLLLVNSPQQPVAGPPSHHGPLPATMPALGGSNSAAPFGLPPNNITSTASNTIFVNQFAAPPQPQPAPMTPSVPPLGPNQTVMVNTPQGPMALNTVPSQPNQHPSALILPNGQIVPVVTQPSLLFPPQHCTPVTGGLLIPSTPAAASQPMVNLMPTVSAPARMNVLTSNSLTTPIVSVAAGNAPGIVRGMLPLPVGPGPNFAGPPQVAGSGPVLQAVPAQGHLSVRSTSSIMTGVTGSVGPCPRAPTGLTTVPNLPPTMMATMTPEGTIILTVPTSEPSTTKCSTKSKKGLAPRPLMPKPSTSTIIKTEVPTSVTISTPALGFLTSARLPTLAPPALIQQQPQSSLMSVVSAGNYVVPTCPSIAVGAPSIGLTPVVTPLSTVTVSPLTVTVCSDTSVSNSITASTPATDILAKATESIFMLSPSGTGENLSPTGLYLCSADSQLQIDVNSEPTEPAFCPQRVPKSSKSRPRSKRKPKPADVPSSQPAGQVDSTAMHLASNIFDQLDGTEVDDEQSDINEFSDLIRLEPMTPLPTTTAKEQSSKNMQKAEVTNTDASSVEVLNAENMLTDDGTSSAKQDERDSENTRASPVNEVTITDQQFSLPDAKKDTAEVTITSNDNVKSDGHLELSDTDMKDSALQTVPSGNEMSSNASEVPTSSSKTLFERLEEAFLSSPAESSLTEKSTGKTRVEQTQKVGKQSAANRIEKEVVECEVNSEKVGLEKESSSALMDKIGKVLSIDRNCRLDAATSREMSEDLPTKSKKAEKICLKIPVVDSGISSTAAVDKDSDTVVVEVKQLSSDRSRKKSRKKKKVPTATLR